MARGLSVAAFRRVGGLAAAMAQRNFDPASSPSHLLHRARQIAFDLHAAEVGVSGLTPRQFAVLAAVERHDGASQTGLVAQTGIDRSTLADMIARLIAKDLLARKRTENDHRANAVHLTAKGIKALRAAMTAVARAEARVLDPLPAAKRPEFLRLLAAIAGAGRARK